MLNDCVIDDRALGTWAKTPNEKLLRITVHRNPSECAYQLGHEDAREGIIFGNLVARLTRVGSELFADVHYDRTNMGISIKKDDVPAWDWINIWFWNPIHRIFWVDQRGTQIHIRSWNLHSDLTSLCNAKNLAVTEPYPDMELITDTSEKLRICLGALSVDELEYHFEGSHAISLERVTSL